MFSLWAKELDEDNKIIKHQTFDFKQEFDAKYLYQYLTIICGEFKIETPVVLSKHLGHFAFFNNVKFSQADFIDKTNFKNLLIQVL